MSFWQIKCSEKKTTELWTSTGTLLTYTDNLYS